MRGLLITALVLASSAGALAQEDGTQPIFWCDISRSQVSHERDAALAQIETLKRINANLDARIKALEAKAQEVKPQ